MNLCEQFPKAAAKMQDYCIKQLEHLSKIRQRKEHLHHGNYVNHYYRKNQIFMETKADVNSDMAIKVQMLNEEQMQSEIDRMLNLIAGFIDTIEEEVCENMKQLMLKHKNLKIRNNTSSFINRETMMDETSISTTNFDSIIENMYGPTIQLKSPFVRQLMDQECNLSNA